MVVYYQDESVEVTTDAITVDGRAYPFAELTRVWHERHRRSWRAVAGRGVWGATYLLPFAGAIVGLAVAFVLDVSTGARIAIAVTAIAIGLVAGPLIDPVLGKLDDSFDRGIHLCEIWVEHKGLSVRVLGTPDAARFGRIYRAVQRAAGG